jgi:hypothetical protein
MTAKKKIDTSVDGEQLTLNTGTTPETEKENSEAVTQATVIEDIEKADIVEFGKKDLRTYNSLMNGIEKGFNKASEAYITIGCALYQIHPQELIYNQVQTYRLPLPAYTKSLYVWTDYQFYLCCANPLTFHSPHFELRTSNSPVRM